MFQSTTVIKFQIPHNNLEIFVNLYPALTLELMFLNLYVRELLSLFSRECHSI